PALEGHDGAMNVFDDVGGVVADHARGVERVEFAIRYTAASAEKTMTNAGDLGEGGALFEGRMHVRLGFLHEQSGGCPDCSFSIFAFSNGKTLKAKSPRA